MKLLLNQGLPPSTAELLREQGLDAVHVSEIGYARADDSEIIELARTEERIVITLDADYHAAIALTSANFPSVIWIRVANLRGSEYVEIITSTLTEYQETLLTGVLITIRADRTIRLKLLPINLDN
jgi:predicted nuclease of predicted toxin-antitoxin system